MIGFVEPIGPFSCFILCIFVLDVSDYGAGLLSLPLRFVVMQFFVMGVGFRRSILHIDVGGVRMELLFFRGMYVRELVKLLEGNGKPCVYVLGISQHGYYLSMRLDNGLTVEV